MARPLHVYGWLGWRLECPPGANGGRQTREVIAATSVAEVLRKTETRRSDYALQGDITANPEEVVLAMSRPGVNFWKPIDGRGPDAWRADESSPGRS
jgi:hypothetical protein